MRFVYAGLFLLSASILLLQVALTRVLAIMMWHHLTYMVVSIALMGFGAAGSILTARGRAAGRPSVDRIAFHASAYGVSVIVALLVVTQIPVDTLAIRENRWNLLRLGLVYATIFVPFLFGGFAVGIAITHFASHVNRVYFSDLVGSAVGAFASVALLGWFRSDTAVILAGGLGVAAATLFALGASRRRLRRTLWVFAPTSLVCAGFATGWLEWHVPYAPGKEFARSPILANASSLRLASPIAEVEVSDSFPRVRPMIGGDFGVRDLVPVEGRIVGQDGTAPTMLYAGAADVSRFPFLDDSQAGSAYLAHRARGGASPRVLVIGVGGGIDVMIALAHGASRVTGVEINRAMIRMATRTFDAYLGGLFRPGPSPPERRVELVHGEGRSFVRSHPDRYDIIQLSGVDSFTALSTGAYTLSESYLYTVEAVQDLYARLADAGYLSFSRFILSHPKKPRETLRLAFIARVALERLGVPDPSSQILVFRGRNWASTMVKRGAFTRPEVEALQAFARQQGFWGVVFDPLQPPGKPLPPSAQRERQAERVFRRAVERGEVGGLDQVLGAETLVAELLSAYRHQASRDTEAGQAILRRLASSNPAGSTSELEGDLEQLVETVAASSPEAERSFQETRRDFLTVLRGGAAERGRFVEAYPYDLTPSTDDAPFFFNYYRYGALLRRQAGERSRSATLHQIYHPDYPVGHAVLLGSLVQISVLAGMLILLPLRWLAREGVATPDRWRILAYFSALGAGFMFVEISVMQKTVLFLGHPTYSVAVVLAGLLGFAGLGSLWSGRVGTVTRGVLLALLVAVPLLVGGVALAVDRLLPALLDLGFAARVAVVIALLAPPGIVLGMPFPLGIRIVQEHSPALLPWAWAINAFLSVFSSIFCIVLAMALGFSTVLLLAALIYALGLLAMLPRLRPA